MSWQWAVVAGVSVYMIIGLVAVLVFMVVMARKF